MNQPPRILIACIGNIFLGDDAFGFHVAQELLRRHDLPDTVRVVDFGIRGIDLAYALMDNWDASILVDAAPRGDKPGTLYLIKPDLSQPRDNPAQPMFIEAHSLTPASVLAMVHSFGGNPGRVFIVGCEPTPLDPHEDIQPELTPPVQRAIVPASEMVLSLVTKLQTEILPTETHYAIPNVTAPS